MRSRSCDDAVVASDGDGDGLGKHELVLARSAERLGPAAAAAETPESSQLTIPY